MAPPSVAHFYNNIRIGSWNIQGIFKNIGRHKVNKINDTEFGSVIRNLDIFCLLESHVGSLENLSIEGYSEYLSHRKKSGNNRYFGGLALYIKQNIRKGIKIVRNTSPDIIWIKLDHSFFNLPKDIFVAFIYISPKSSQYFIRNNLDLESVYNTLENDCAEFSKKGNICLLGDFNAHTADQPDFIVSDESDDKFLNLPFESYSSDAPQKRKNVDTHPLDESGKLLISLCKSASLQIQNGRCRGDTKGSYTRFPLHNSNANEPSTIDYCLIQDELSNKAKLFYVNHLTSLSDHCCISISLDTKHSFTFAPDKNNEFETVVEKSKLPEKFMWNENCKEKFLNVLNDNTTKKKIDEYLVTDFEKDDDGINLATVKLTKIICDVGEKSVPLMKIKAINKKPKFKKKWYSQDCLRMKNSLSRLSKQIKKEPFNRDLQNQYRHLFQSYKSTLNKREREYSNKLKKLLLEMENSNPKEFWNLIGKMKENNNVGKKQPLLSDSEYQSYFNKLYKNKTIDSSENIELGTLLKDTNIDISSYLNKDLTEKEILDAASSLKGGKAAGLDRIIYEFLKHGRYVLLKPIKKLFEIILVSNCYPSLWVKNILVTIHKSGSRDDLDNYRGISIGSCFGKLFGVVLTNRLLHVIKKYNIIGHNQIGFMSGHRPADHVFVLNTLINKVVKNRKQQLFAAFIDFRKAYDRINREHLFQKLNGYGIHGNFYRTLNNMYKQVEQLVKVNNYLLEPILTSLGLKQGCNLSPVLFNLFIEDIKDIFNRDCFPTKLDDQEINHLLYADDMILLSLTKEGLQECLNRLSVYCQKWGLEVNLDKSKVIIFSRCGRIPQNLQFTFNNNTITIVQKYKYLGTIISASGSFSQAKEELIDKGKKAYFSIRKVLQKTDFDVKLSLHLFDSVIKPILTYNCEVWSQFTQPQLNLLIKGKHNRSNLFESYNNEIEQKHLKFCKTLLGLNKKASNVATLGELGRFPLKSFCYVQQLKFLYRLSHIEKSTFVYKAYLDSEKLSNSGNFSWALSVTYLCKLLNCTDIMSKINSMSKTQFNAYCHKLLENEYLDYWRKKVFVDKIDESGNKLRTYRIFKKDFKLENYTMMKSRTLKKSLAQFRCANHRLEIELGRRLDIPRDKRYCLICDQAEVGDEMHYLLNCKTLEMERETAFSKISEFDHSFRSLNKIDKFIYLLSNENDNVLTITAGLIRHFNDIRELMLQNQHG